MADFIREALGALEEARDATKAPGIVFFSGGKDSVCCLALAKRVYGDNLHAVFMYLVDGIEAIEHPGRVICKKYGVQLHKIPHYSLAMALKESFMAPHWALKARQRRTLKYIDMERWARHITGGEYVILGQRKTDSLERRAMISKGGLCMHPFKRVYPIGNWTDREVRAFVRNEKVPLASNFGGGVRSGGFGIDEETMTKARIEYPKDYAKAAKMFPFLGAYEARKRFFGEKNDDEGDGE